MFGKLQAMRQRAVRDPGEQAEEQKEAEQGMHREAH
jgi:hypothetical protein